MLLSRFLLERRRKGAVVRVFCIRLHWS